MSSSDTTASQVTCPVCSQQVLANKINDHLDKNCLKGSSKSTTSSQSNLAPLFNVKGRKESAARKESSTQLKRHSDTRLSGPSTKRNKVSHHFQDVAPLAEKMRPRTLAQFVGQCHITAPDTLFRQAISQRSIGSMIFWGPPGCGKTTLGRLLAHETGSIFKELSATNVGINDVRGVFEEAKNTLALSGKRTVLFIDEIHRFNKAQQDIFLPYVEQGQIQLIGATTENPSFKLTGALLSRCRVLVLNRLADDEVKTILTKSLEKLLSEKESDELVDLERSSPEPSSSWSSSASTTTSGAHITEKVMSTMVSLSNGDARTALSLLELVVAPSNPPLSEEALLQSLRQAVSVSYDRTGDSHYDMISALHKSVRGSKADAAMYWLARMLTAGEDPMFVARRMVVCASEDIGLADNHALPLAMATLQACQTIGMPECRINLAHLVAYLAEAPKSTRAYEAYKLAEAKAKSDPSAPVPMQVRNAPTSLMSELGYGKEYHYNPDYAHPVSNRYVPEQFEKDVYLRKEGDLRNKMWDEDALKEWERIENGGEEWEGRRAK